MSCGNVVISQVLIINSSFCELSGRSCEEVSSLNREHYVQIRALTQHLNESHYEVKVGCSSLLSQFFI